MALPMVEDTDGVENLDQILIVPAVDVFPVVANDLAQSMGNAGPEEVQELMRQDVPKIGTAGKNVGIGSNPLRRRFGGRVHQAGGELRYRNRLGTVPDSGPGTRQQGHESWNPTRHENGKPIQTRHIRD